MMGLGGLARNKQALCPLRNGWLPCKQPGITVPVDTCCLADWYCVYGLQLLLETVVFSFPAGCITPSGRQGENWGIICSLFPVPKVRNNFTDRLFTSSCDGQPRSMENGLCCLGASRLSLTPETTLRLPRLLGAIVATHAWFFSVSSFLNKIIKLGYKAVDFLQALHISLVWNNLPPTSSQSSCVYLHF